jgi:uncharacterized protein YrrD
VSIADVENVRLTRGFLANLIPAREFIPLADSTNKRAKSAAQTRNDQSAVWDSSSNGMIEL